MASGEQEQYPSNSLQEPSPLKGLELVSNVERGWWLLSVSFDRADES